MFVDLIRVQSVERVALLRYEWSTEAAQAEAREKSRNGSKEKFVGTVATKIGL